MSCSPCQQKYSIETSTIVPRQAPPSGLVNNQLTPSQQLAAPLGAYPIPQFQRGIEPYRRIPNYGGAGPTYSLLGIEPNVNTPQFSPLPTQTFSLYSHEEQIPRPPYLPVFGPLNWQSDVFALQGRVDITRLEASKLVATTGDPVRLDAAWTCGGNTFGSGCDVRVEWLLRTPSGRAPVPDSLDPSSGTRPYQRDNFTSQKSFNMPGEPVTIHFRIVQARPGVLGASETIHEKQVVVEWAQPGAAAQLDQQRKEEKSKADFEAGFEAFLGPIRPVLPILLLGGLAIAGIMVVAPHLKGSGDRAERILDRLVG